MLNKIRRTNLSKALLHKISILTFADDRAITREGADLSPYSPTNLKLTTPMIVLEESTRINTITAELNQIYKCILGSLSFIYVVSDS